MKKSVKRLMILSIVFTIIAALIFALLPLAIQAIANSGGAGELLLGNSLTTFIYEAAMNYGFVYSGNLLLDTIVGTTFGLLQMFNFNVLTPYSLSSLVVLCVFLIVWLLWLIMTIVHKKPSSVEPLVVSLFTFSISFFMLYSYEFMVVSMYGTYVNMLTYSMSLIVEGAPLYAVILMGVVLVLTLVIFIFIFVHAFIDLCNKRRFYEDGSALDTPVNEDEVTSVEELRKLLDGEVVSPLVKEENKSTQLSSTQTSPSLGNQPFVLQQFFGANPMNQNLPLAEKKEENNLVAEPSLSKEEIYKIIKDEVSSSVDHAMSIDIMHSELPNGHENEIRAIIREEVTNALTNSSKKEDEALTEEKPFPFEKIRQLIHEEVNAIVSDEVRKIVREELDEVTVKSLPAYEPQPQIIKEIIRVETPSLAKEEAEEEKEEESSQNDEHLAQSKEVVEPLPVIEEEVPNNEKSSVEPLSLVESETIEETLPLEETHTEEKATIIRIPFTDRIRLMDPQMRANFNELKSDIMAYGVKSRVSNSGDTFRLHTKTYVKITIAGKSLKLYFALNPNDYKDSTLPISDAGHKGIYKEIPLVFKVKSDLSLRRAKQLVNEAMSKDGLTKGEVVSKDWIQEIIDTVPESGKLNEATIVDEEEE